MRAFPNFRSEGMELRDYFAAVALQGTLSNPYIADNSPMDRNQISTYAYELADAMLKAREQKDE